ncbi:TetR/AcrR family transcriptional regulator [Natronospirillum operosum]|uniref:TetR/AcrR family transcriptional regulator n=1 Tax=Natronospirillum operosum TaxID=2759953 RepID=A0A4Z0WIH8_9GAMM|nr:TetR/AcrR family transcriptional regulator [Natronospirillum operosum]TGG94935.1 TetR/AcrR family transcriptional regulator [Natronospirillum operosum]
MKRTKAAQSEATTGRLLAVAREHFTRDGYAAAATERIVAEAGVTRGALYHHFGNKLGLYRGVLEQVHAEVGQRVEAAAMTEQDPWQALQAGCRAFLEVAADADVQRIMLLDAPAVLGWAEWRAMDARHSMRHLQEQLELLAQEGYLHPLDTEALAYMLSGAMNEATLWIATQENPQRALQKAADSLHRLLAGLAV